MFLVFPVIGSKTTMARGMLTFACFTVFCSGMPPLILGIFEKDITEKVIEKYPGK
jgi:hypothetical protein